jgi:hypothetical protein
MARGCQLDALETGISVVLKGRITNLNCINYPRGILRGYLEPARLLDWRDLDDFPVFNACPKNRLEPSIDVIQECPL